MDPKDYVGEIRKRGLTQAQVSEATGIPQPTISKIERGDVADVMSRNYRALQSMYERVKHLPLKGCATSAVAPPG